jgi:hypothetical protein
LWRNAIEFSSLGVHWCCPHHSIGLSMNNLMTIFDLLDMAWRVCCSAPDSRNAE